MNDGKENKTKRNNESNKWNKIEWLTLLALPKAVRGQAIGDQEEQLGDLPSIPHHKN